MEKTSECVKKHLSGFFVILAHSSLSANAPEFVPGAPPGMMVPLNHMNPEHPEFQPNHQFNQAPQYQYTPYTPQQPIPELQSFAIHQRMTQLSISSRLNQYQHPPPLQQPPIPPQAPAQNFHHPLLNNGVPPTGRFNVHNGPSHNNGVFNRQHAEQMKQQQNSFEESHIPVSLISTFLKQFFIKGLNLFCFIF